MDSKICEIKLNLSFLKSAEEKTGAVIYQWQKLVGTFCWTHFCWTERVRQNATSSHFEHKSATYPANK